MMFFVLLLFLFFSILLGYLTTLLIAYLAVRYSYTTWFTMTFTLYPIFQCILQPFQFQKTILDIINLSLKPFFPLLIQLFRCDQMSLNWKWGRFELPQISALNLDIQIQITNKSQWDLLYGKELARSRKHALANYLTSLIENVQVGPKLSIIAHVIDYFLRNINLRVSNARLM
jgi:hypothetical protein